MGEFNFNSVTEVLSDLKLGKLVVVVDDESRENEGDLIGAADKCTPEMINFMAMYGRGLICAAITEERSRKPRTVVGDISERYVQSKGRHDHRRRYRHPLDIYRYPPGAPQRGHPVGNRAFPSAGRENFQRLDHV